MDPSESIFRSSNTATAHPSGIIPFDSDTCQVVGRVREQGA
ncbi:MAG: hypothetical protein ACYCTV_01475 [Leptospirales bacterium]